jgi:tRNA 2-thiouridine synthesizing protein A
MMADWTADESWDAGDLACGELILDLRQRIKKLRPRQTFYLVTRDPGAVLDIPAWCRLTGHALKQAEHPNYLIQRKDNS